MKKRPVQPSFKKLAPGEYLVRIPAGYSGFSLPEAAITLSIIDDLVADPEPKPATPTPGRKPTPEPSPEERRVLRAKHRLVVLQRVATSQRHLDALTFDEGLPTTLWVEQNQQEQQRNKRRARERQATYKPKG